MAEINLCLFSSILSTCCILILNIFLRIEGRFQNLGVVSDNIREDDYDDFDLTDIIALADTRLDWADERVKPYERMETVHQHNSFRMNFTYPFPECNNMNMLEYNNTLEWSAMLVVEMCKWEHLFGPGDNMTAGQNQGQCLYQGSIPRGIVGLNVMYHAEFPHYFFNNFTCRKPFPKYQCGHMLQIMMGRTEHVGWNRRLCWPRQRNYLGCWHYYIGVIDDIYPENLHFYYGTPCSNCKPGFHCSGNLCIPQPERFCTAYEIDCECKRTCLNCASLDLKNCKCICKLGWDWNHCSFPCKDKWEDRKGKNECMYYTSHCSVKFIVTEILCRKRCKTCLSVKRNSPPEKLCCGGKICPEYHRLDLNTCECIMMCPSILCMYPSTTTTTPTTIATSTPMTTTTTPSTTATSTKKTTTPSTTATSTKKTTPSTTATSTKKTTTSTLSTTSTSEKETQSTSTIPSTQQPTPEEEPRPISKGYLVIESLRMLLLSLTLTLII